MPGAHFEAIKQILGWYNIIIALIVSGCTLMVAVNGFKIMTAASDDEQVIANKRIKNTLVFLAISLSLITILKYIINLYGI